MAKEYKSELGKLYQSKREEAPLQKIVFEIYSLFKFWIESGEMLPINVSAKDYEHLDGKSIYFIQEQLLRQGCVVYYQIVGVDVPTFQLIDLV